jgi:hypothetical protein
VTVGLRHLRQHFGEALRVSQTSVVGNWSERPVTRRDTGGHPYPTNSVGWPKNGSHTHPLRLLDNASKATSRSSHELSTQPKALDSRAHPISHPTIRHLISAIHQPTSQQMHVDDECKRMGRGCMGWGGRPGGTRTQVRPTIIIQPRPHSHSPTTHVQHGCTTADDANDTGSSERHRSCTTSSSRQSPLVVTAAKWYQGGHSKAVRRILLFFHAYSTSYCHIVSYNT